MEIGSDDYNSPYEKTLISNLQDCSNKNEKNQSTNVNR